MTKQANGRMNGSASRRRALLPLMACLLLLAACAGRPGRVASTSSDPASRGPRVEIAAIGQSVHGRWIDAITIGDGNEMVLFLATIHGNEPAGTPLLYRLAHELERDPARLHGRRVVLIPVMNPDGLLEDLRNNVRGVDLNRNFPASNRRERPSSGPDPLSEPESTALHEFITRDTPVLIVSIHQPLACVDFDGPARTLAEAMARACRLPVRKLGAMPGSLGAFAGEELGIPVITLELPRDAMRHTSEDLWDRYGPALRLAIEWRHDPLENVASITRAESR